MGYETVNTLIPIKFARRFIARPFVNVSYNF